MRPLVIVFRAEPREPTLLRAGVRRRGPCGFGFEHRMELLVRAVLLGVPQGNALGHNPEAHPPHREPRQAPDAGARKRTPVIAPDALRQPIFSEGALKALARGCVGRAWQGVTAQHEATEAIAQRQRVAYTPSPVRKWPLKSVVQTSL